MDLDSVQAGIDFISKDGLMFTFDVRQYFLKLKMIFKKGFLNSDSDVVSAVVWNPIVVFVGFRFKL